MKHLLSIISLLILFTITCLAQVSKSESISLEEPYKVLKISSPIIVDGKANEQCWNNAYTASFDYYYRTEKPNDKQTTQFKMLWDDEHIYVLFECKDKYLTAREEERDGVPYLDDCAEIFFIPTSDKINMHFGFEINLYKASNDFVFFNEFHKGEDLLVKGYNPNFNVEVYIDGTLNDNSDIDKGWAMEIAIPFKEMEVSGPFAPAKGGSRWAFLAVRQDRNEVDSERRSLSTLYPMKPDFKNVHDPESFGLMEFVDK